MKQDFQKKLKEFKNYLTNLEYINSASNALYWDMRVNAPKKAVAYRGEVLGYLAGEAYKMQTSDTMKQFIEYFSHCEDMDDVTKRVVEKAKEDYEKRKKIPEDRNRKFVVLTSNAESIWEEAKEKSDFELFKPYLKKIVDFQNEFIAYWGYNQNKYDTLLDLYEPGITVEKLDKIFGELRDAILILLSKIKNSSVKPNDKIFKQNFSKEDQESFSRFVLEKMGYDFQAGRLDESVHPFTIEFDNKDVRITTKYYENEFTSALFSCIHEGGHALYEQDIPDELKGTMLGHGTSMGVHESQSRFYENIVGRSKSFWKYFYPELQRRFSQFKNVEFEDFYAGINTVEPSLIRTEADELTYSLHVIIRYEIEKALINGEIKVEELPRVWKEKYKQYIGIEPQNDAEGVLQDVHWAGGDFGYFSSYALGNIYGAQFLNKMEKDMPKMYEEIEKGNLNQIHEWLKENVHKYGAVYKPAELIKKVTGEELNAKYFIDYLNKKYAEIYKL